MTLLAEGVYAGEFLISEAQGCRSRDVGTLITGQDLAAGTVVGKITTAATATAATAAAIAGNTGNGTMGTVTPSLGVKPGVYKLLIVEPVTNVGDFIVEDPDGIIIGTGNVAAAFSAGGLAFTLADGATDFAVGDGFTITVAAGSGKFTQLDLTSAVGANVAAGVIFDNVDATSADVDAVFIVRDAEVDDNKLTWPSGISGGDKTTAIAQLAALGIIVRGA